MDQVLKRALEMVVGSVTADDGVIMLVDPTSDKLLPRKNNEQTHPTERVANWLLNNEHALIVDDLRKQSYWDKNTPSARSWRSVLGVLLETNDAP